MIFSMRSKLFLKGILGPGATPESQITEYKKNASKKRGEHEIQQFSEQPHQESVMPLSNKQYSFRIRVRDH